VQGDVLKVLDFGIAKAMQDGERAAEQTTHTSSGFHAFSPQYGAPEQFRSKRFGGTGPWTDVHALGLILTELVVGRPAMLGEEQADFYEQAMADSRPTPRACGATVSDAFETVCRRCLARDPAERIQDADELLGALDALEMGVRELMASRPASARNSDRPARSGSTPTEVADTEVAPAAEGSPHVPSLVPPQAAARAPDPPLPADESLVRESTASKPPAASSPPAVAPAPAPPSSTRWTLALVATAIASAAVLAGVFGWWLPAREREERKATIGEPVPVPGGAFRMGSEEGAPDQRPEHDVVVAPFELDRTEVTVEAFALCVQEGKCEPTDTVHLTGVPESQKEDWDAFCNWGKPGREQHPMNCVDWNQADAFCQWAGKRLPAEPEWEYAAKGGDQQRTYPWGEESAGKVLFNGCSHECVEMALGKGWKWKPLEDADDGWPSTAPVGTFPSTAARWGHQDLAGNVWEWTASPFCNYDDDSPDACSKVHVAARGGGWASRYAGIFRTAFRAKFPKEYRAQDVGFRCAR